MSQVILEDTAVTGPPLPTPNFHSGNVRKRSRSSTPKNPTSGARRRKPPPSLVNQGLTVQNTVQNTRVPQSTGTRLRDPGPAWDEFLRNCTSGPSRTLSWGTPGGKGVVTAVAASRPTPAPPRVLLDSTRDRSSHPRGCWLHTHPPGDPRVKDLKRAPSEDRDLVSPWSAAESEVVEHPLCSPDPNSPSLVTTASESQELPPKHNRGRHSTT